MGFTTQKEKIQDISKKRSQVRANFILSGRLWLKQKNGARQKKIFG